MIVDRLSPVRDADGQLWIKAYKNDNREPVCQYRVRDLLAFLKRLLSA